MYESINKQHKTQNMSKQYGLILPGSKSSNAKPKVVLQRPSIFGSDSDSDEQETKRPKFTGPGAFEKRQALRVQEKALKEDPTVYHYDELYDDIESKRIEEKQAKSKDERKPKYIERLLETAERRKLENERRLERTVQKEREKEGSEFADKESFVTSAYRLKLEELKKAEEREKREDYLEAIGDVTKQQDLGGFYRHIYEQKLKIKEEKENAKESKVCSEEESTAKVAPPGKVQSKAVAKTRAYRKRQSSDEEDASATVQKGTSSKAHLQSNLDADSDFSIDESTDSESEDKKECPKDEKASIIKVEVVDDNATVENQTVVPVVANGKENGIPTDALIKTEPADDKTVVDSQPKSEAENKSKTKKDIWKKRTVGTVFEDALARYYERKAARNG